MLVAIRRPSRVLLIWIVAIAAVVASLAPAGAGSRAADRSATDLGYHPELVLVSFKSGASASSRANAHAALDGVVANRLGHAGIDVVRVPAGVDPAAAAAAYSRNPAVKFAQPNYVMRITGTPNDVLLSDEWGLHNTGQMVKGSLVRGVADIDIDAPEGWTAAFGATSFPSTGGTRVGIIDTGIDLGHADLLGKTKACASAVSGLGIVTNGSCADDNLHGTHVAGTIAATANNSVGVAGVAPNAELAIFKALNSAGVGFYADIVAGVHWAHTTGQAKVISMSIGGPQDKALDAELTEASNAGALLIAAAGNDYDDTKNWPAYHSAVMSVGSVNQAGKKSDFSNCNSDVEIAAPGEDIWSTTPGNSYAVISGTSMATPHVSGVAAMVMWKKGLSASQTRSTLKSTTEDSGGCGNTGVVNLARALGSTTTTTTTKTKTSTR